MLMSMPDGVELEQAYTDLAGKRVLVTGVSESHGVEIARAFADHRARLVLHVASLTPEMEALGAIVAESALDVRMYDGPLASTDDAVRLARSAVQAFGGLDAVVNIAKISPPAGGTAASQNDVEDTVSRLLTAACLVSKVAANRMRVTLTEGAIINVAMLPPRPCAATKAVAALVRSTLANLTHSEATQWAPYGIRINAVAPATLGGRGPDGITGEPDIASLALHLASASGHQLSGLVFESQGA